jgi:predicted HicB family RNase H-like nuclease
MSTTIQKQFQITSEFIMPDELEKIVNFRDTKKNREFYKKEAKKRGVSLSDFIRSIIWKHFEFIPKDYLKIKLDDFLFSQLKEKAEAKDVSVENYIKKLILKDLNDVKQTPEVRQRPPKRVPNMSKPKNITKKRSNNPHNLPYITEMKKTIQKGSKKGFFDPNDILKPMEQEREKHFKRIRERTIREALLRDLAIEKAIPYILILEKLEVKEIGAN